MDSILNRRTDDHHFHTYDGPIAPEEARFGANDIGWQALGPALACSLLATTVVIARWYSRCRLARCVGVDDYVILFSLTLSWAMTTTIGIAVNEGIGIYHTDPEGHTIARLLVAGNVLWILIVNITKASILSQYLRIFCTVGTRKLCYLLLFLLISAAGYAIFGGVFLCHPTAKLWDPDIEGTCRSAETYWLSVAGMDIGLDILVLVFPLPAILAIRLPPRQKIGLVLVFTLGFFVCAISIVRLVTVYTTAHYENDIVASGVWSVIWSAVEANVGIICACLLALKPLAAKWFPSLFDETRLPRHCTRLKPVDTSAARFPTSLEVPATPSSGFSGKGVRPMMKRWSTARVWVPSQSGEPKLREVENVGVVEREQSPRPGGAGGEEVEGEEQRLSIWNMLQRPEEVANTGREADHGKG